MRNKLLICLQFVIIFVFSGCSPTITTCNLESMVLPQESIPLENIQTLTLSPAPEGTAASIIRTYYLNPGTMNAVIHYHTLSFQAKNDYEYLIATQLNPQYEGQSWSVPVEFNGIVLNADEFSYGCEIEDSPICFTIARYGPYTLQFTSHVFEDESMTINVYKDLMENLDEKIRACINN